MVFDINRTSMFIHFKDEHLKLYEFLYYCLIQKITPSFHIISINTLHRMVNNTTTLQDIYILTGDHNIANDVCWRLWQMTDIERYHFIDRLLIDLRTHISTFATHINTVQVENHLATRITNMYVDMVDVQLCSDYLTATLLFWIMKHLYIYHVNMDPTGTKLDFKKFLADFRERLLTLINKEEADESEKSNMQFMLHNVKVISSSV